MSRLYRCVYAIDVDAESYLDAAEQCYDCMLTGQAPVIQVMRWSRDEQGSDVLPLEEHIELIDLSEFAEPLVD